MSSQSCEKIKVYGRIRPSKEDNVHKVVDIDNGRITVTLNEDTKSFPFDGIFGEDSNQEEVFDVAAARIVDGTLQGYNGTIFAYGQTGSGKTHTMIGPSSIFDQKSSGIIPRGLYSLFNQLDQKTQAMPGIFSSKIAISFVEIYNEAIYDLFSVSEEKLKVGQDQEGNVIIKGATEIFVKDLSDAMEEVNHGWKNRSVAETAMNRASSRSHALLLIKIRTEEVHGAISTGRSAFLNLVDLAGSERVSQSKVEGERLKETAHINTSLLTLKRVIRELTEQNKTGFISFRSSVLTHILKDSLGGNARTAVMINVHPDKKYYSETLSTLQFAAEVRRIENKVVMNEDLKGDSVVAYQAEIKRLQIEVDEIKNKSSEQLAEMKRSLEAWKEAAIKYERQLAVARRNAANVAIATRRDGYGASQAENLWQKSMCEVADSIRNLPTSSIRSIQLRDLTEQLNLCIFEKDELKTQLDHERTAKGELQEKLNNAMAGVLSPRRPNLGSTSSQEGSSVTSMLGNPLEASFSTPSASKKDRRRTRYEKPNERKSTFFRPVLNVEAEEEQINEPVGDNNTEERREMELEMTINQKEQIIEEKMRECEQLTRLLSEAEKRIAEAEGQMVDSIKSSEEEKKKVNELKVELEKVENVVGEMRSRLAEMEKSEAFLEEQAVQARTENDRLHSDMALIKSTHFDEMKELELRLKSNLSDKEKKEVDLIKENDSLKKDLELANSNMINLQTEHTTMEEVLRSIVENGKVDAEEARLKSERLEQKIASLEEQLDEQRIMEKKMEESAAECDRIQRAMEELRVGSEEKMKEKDELVEHWKTVSSQFASKMDEMKAEFNVEKDKRLEVELRENRLNVAFKIRMAENEELKERINEIGSHGNSKQKIHIMHRYVEDKRVLQSRVTQLEALLQKHGLTVPTPQDEPTVEGEENRETDEGHRESLASNDNATSNRRPARVLSSVNTASSSTVPTAASGRTRSSRTAAAKK